MKTKNKQKSSGFGSSVLSRVRTVGWCGFLVLLSSCSMNRPFEKGGTMLGTGLGVGGGHYMCQSSGMDPKFGIGCMVLGGLMGGVLGGIMGETFDNREIYDTVRNNNTGHEPNVYSKSDGSKMKVQVVDDYVEDQGPSLVGDKTNTWCKDFEFEVEKNGIIERGRGKSCRDEFGKWETMGIDLIE